MQSLGLSNTRDSFNKLFSGKKAIRKTPKFSQTRPLEVSINLCPVWLSFGLLLAVGFVHHFLLENQFAKHLLCVFRSQEDTDCDVTLSAQAETDRKIILNLSPGTQPLVKHLLGTAGCVPEPLTVTALRPFSVSGRSPSHPKLNGYKSCQTIAHLPEIFCR